MFRRDPSLLFSLFMFCCCVSLNAAPPQTTVMDYDLMTRTDMKLSHYLNPDPHLEYVSQWPVVEGVVSMGRDIIDAEAIATELRGMSVNEQPAFRHVKKIVDECAYKLGIEPPKLFVRHGAELDVYVAGIKEPHMLVLTSGFYELFKDRPDELRFVIGHELGHIKCNHIRPHAVGRALMRFVQGNNRGRFSKGYVAKLIVGQLLAWYRESEFSADRAGFICVNGDRKIAESALLRFKHGTQENIDVDIANREHIDFLREPFVRIMLKVKSRGDSPYIFDRITKLRQWQRSDAFKELVNRDKLPNQRKLVIDEIRVQGLPNADYAWGDAKKCDPIIRAAIGRRKFQSKSIDNNNDPWIEFESWSAACTQKTPVIIEVLDYDATFSNDVMGDAMFQVTGDEGTEQQSIQLVLRNQANTDAAASDLPKVTVYFHIES